MRPHRAVRDVASRHAERRLLPRLARRLRPEVRQPRKNAYKNVYPTPEGGVYSRTERRSTIYNAGYDMICALGDAPGASLARRIALCWLVLLGPVLTGRAQTLGEPAPQRPTDAPPGEIPAGGGPTRTWQVFLGLYGGYATNVDFVTPEDPGDTGLVGRASLAHTRRSERGEVNFSLQGGGVHYRELTDANHLDGAAGLGFRYRLSSRASLGLDASASYLNSDVSQTLIGAGLQLPRTQTLGYGGGLRLDVSPGERTSLGLSVRYDDLDFDAPELLDTESAHAGLVLSRRMSARSSLSLSYGFLRTNDLSQGFDSHEAALGWSRILAPRLTLSLAGGPGYARDPLAGDQGERWYYYGTAGLTGQIRRSTVNLQLRRSSNPAYGLGGNRLSYGASFSAGIPFGRRARLALTGVHTWSEDPIGQASDYVTDDGTAAFTLTFLRRLGLSLGYGYRRNDPEDKPVVTSHRGAVGLTWSYSRP